MKILKWLAGILAAILLFLVAAFVAAGLMMPAERSFTNEVEINAPAEKVWQVIADKKRYTEWQTNLERVEVINERDHAGGAFWIEYPKGSPQPLKFTERKDDRPRSMEFEYSMGQDVWGNWTGEITPTSSGVKLKTTDGYKTNGWLTKIMIGAFFDLDSFAKDWNSKLKARVESLNN